MQNKVLVWDKWVRTSHWLVAGLFFINAFLTEEGDEIHRYLGYAILGIMCIRWIWGFIGTQYARFSSFFPTPQQIVLHIKHIHDGEKHGLGHNPLAAMMIFALWGVMSALIVSGWMMNLPNQNRRGFFRLAGLGLAGVAASSVSKVAMAAIP